MNSVAISIVFLSILGIVAVVLLAATASDNRESRDTLLAMNYTFQWGSKNRLNPLANPISWVLHLAYGVSVSRNLMLTQPTSDMVFVLWMLTVIAAMIYLSVFIMRLHLVNKSLVHSKRLLVDTQKELDRRLATR